ncbi:MAG: hypothetical protein KDD63_24580 [Bacteroidetes bacterium]|nr:hypothetical protein [Bacteroidota bacterium]MCB0845637.1 hypothetical protein [Bacteroidota bacterium]MCB0855432.1 hypothetical protein [Bacteroidota bacterium]
MDKKIENIRSFSPLIDWDKNPYFTKDFKDQAKVIFDETIDGLSSLEKENICNEKHALPILENCIQRFNQLKIDTRFFIDTQTREKIIEFFYVIIDAFGLSYEYGFLDRDREW